MKSRWLPALLLGALWLGAGCARRPPAPPPPPPAQPEPRPLPKQNLVVLLAGEDGRVGRLTVGNAAGTQELSQANQAVRLESAQVAPSAPFSMDEAEVKRLFGATLDALPMADARFILYFEEARDTLTPQSEALLSEVLEAIQSRRSTNISVTGHTDTTGDPEYNYKLGLRRAERVAGILRSRGLDPAFVFVSSHGEADLLVKTPDGTPEAKNRRVEVVVR